MSIQVTDQGRYRARWYTPEGKHPSRTFDSRSEAERFLRRVGVDIDEGRDTTRDRSRPLQQVIDQWWRVHEGSVKPRTAERYEDHLRQIERSLGARPIGEITYPVVQEFVFSLQAEYAPKTVRHCYGVLALVLKHAHRIGVLEREIPKPILPRVARSQITVPTLAQVEQLAEASQAWLHAAVILAGYGGLRQGELLALHRDDVDLAERWVFVHQARNKTSGALESTKTEQVRRVYLSTGAAAILSDHLDEYPGQRVFGVTASVFDKSWRRARTAADLPGVRFHDLRHCACSLMIAAGCTVLQVCKQMGHANPTQTLDVYGHLWPDSSEDAARRVDEYLAH